MSLLNPLEPVFIPHEKAHRAPFFVRVVRASGGMPLYVASTAVDDYRLKQITGPACPAGEVFCRLGVPLPSGFSETTEVVVHRVDGPLPLPGNGESREYLKRFSRSQLIDCLLHSLKHLNGHSSLTPLGVLSQLSGVLYQRSEYNAQTWAGVVAGQGEFLSSGDFE